MKQSKWEYPLMEEGMYNVDLDGVMRPMFKSDTVDLVEGEDYVILDKEE